MAQLIQAFSAYGPKIELIEAADIQHYMKLITKHTTLSTGVVKNVQESEVETLIDLLLEGRPVHTGVAIFIPDIDTQGNVRLSVRVDKRILSALNSPDAFAGKICNKENIGMTREQYIARWNEDHPDNLIIMERPLQAGPDLLMSS
jgi:hypothetical protein